MAIYEYRCSDCDEAFEITEPIGKHDPAKLPACPKCKGKETERCVSRVAVETTSKSYHPAKGI